MTHLETILQTYALHGMAAPSPDWGDVPTWVGAITTALALIAAGYAAKVSWNVLKVEQVRDAAAAEAAARERDRERRAQADLIATWLQPSAHEDSDNAEIRVRNASSLPVYQVVVEVMAGGAVTAAVPWMVLPPGEVGAALPPGSRGRRQSLVADVYGNEAEGYEHRLEDLSVRLRFIDAVGASWARSESGALIEHSKLAP